MMFFFLFHASELVMGAFYLNITSVEPIVFDLGKIFLKELYKLINLINNLINYTVQFKISVKILNFKS